MILEKTVWLSLNYIMELDGRNLERLELFRKLRELISSCGSNGPIEVLVSGADLAQQVKTFAAMSGCPVETKKEGEYYRVYIAENSCGCGF